MLTKSCHRNFDYRHGKERNIQLRKQELIAYLPEYNSKMEMKRPLKEREREFGWKGYERVGVDNGEQKK